MDANLGRMLWRTALTLSPALALACFVDEPLSGSAGETTTTTTTPTSSTSTATTTTTTTTTTTSDASSSTSSGSGATTASSSTVGESESEGSTTGEPQDTLQLACETYCAFSGACVGMEDPACLPFCLALFANDGNPSAACAEAAVAMVACVEAIGCAALEDLETACPAEHATLSQVCTACMATGAIADLTSCEATLACQVDVHEAQCTSEKCNCSINGAASASCILGANPCAGTVDQLITTARECCKWPA